MDRPIEEVVKALRKFPVEEVGSQDWLLQAMSIERLNLESHKQAQENKFEQVVDYIQTHEKFEVLVHELLATELWMKNCLDKIKTQAPPIATGRMFLCDRAEMVLVNLLELVVYHPESLPNEAVLMLIDYCNRKMAVLTERNVSAFEDGKQDQELSIGFSGLSIIWSLVACTTLGVGVLRRLAFDDDVMLTLCAILQRQPWTYVKEGKVWKWMDTGLKVLSPAERFRVCRSEGQAWTAVQQLLQPRFLELTRWNEHRKAQLLSLEGLVADQLVDQIPVLTDLRRTFQYLKVNQIPEPKFSPIVEIVPEMNEEFEARRDWKAIRKKALHDYFTKESVLKKELQVIAQFFSLFEGS